MKETDEILKSGNRISKLSYFKRRKQIMIIETITKIFQSGQLSGFRGNKEYHLGGKYVQLLEQAFKEYFSIKYAIAFNSATSALHAALVACDVGKSDEVIVSSYSFSSSASCVLMAGAKPVFADIQDDIFCIDPDRVIDAITAKTKAIIPVHLCGHPASMPIISNIADYYGLKVIEDAAQAITATSLGGYVGTIGDCGIFSFNQSKHINTGEGGMMITNDDEIARIARAVRNHGEVSDPELKVVGYNYRMCEIEAALALEQFKNIDDNINYRIELANYLTPRLAEIEGITPPVVYPNCKHAYYTYAVKVKGNKEAICKQLGERGIYFGTYVKPLHLLPIYERFGYKLGDCPVAERMWQRELIVTDRIKAPATKQDMDKMVQAFSEIMNVL